MISMRRLRARRPRSRSPCRRAAPSRRRLRITWRAVLSAARRRRRGRSRCARRRQQHVEDALLGGVLGARALPRASASSRVLLDRDLDEVADDRVDVPADVADLGELGRLDLDERRVGEPRQAARDLGLADAGRADHEDVLRRDLVAQRLVDLLAAPAVAQRDRDRALGAAPGRRCGGRARRRSPAGVMLDLRRRAQSSVSIVWLLVGVDADVAGDARATSRRSRARVELGVARAARAPRPARTAPPEPIATMPCSGSSTSPLPVMMSEALRVGDREHRLEAAQHAVGAPVLGQLDRGAHAGCPGASRAWPRSARTA